MLTVSLHNITIHATRGMYAEEEKLNNHFEVDVDISVAAVETNAMPFVDYSLIRQAVALVFEQPHNRLEDFLHGIFTELRKEFPETGKIKIVIRKLNPPMPGQVGYAQVMYEG